MIFSATVLYYNDKEKALSILKDMQDIDIFDEYIDDEKCVIIIQGEHTDDIENIGKELLKKDVFIDVAHSAFHFGEEIENVDNNLSNIFKSMRK